MTVPMPDLNFNATPISGIHGAVNTSTGAFFSRDNSQPQGSHDLVSANVGTGDIGSLLMVAGAVLFAIVIIKKVK